MLVIKNAKKYLQKYLGVDEAIFWATLNRGLGIVRSPINIYFLLKYLSLEQQGLWYTFTHLSTLSMLADLGFTVIITQFVSHEFANLRLEGKMITGKEEDMGKLFSLIRFAVKFYFKVVVAAVLILIGAGYWYFRNENSAVFLAWTAYSLLGGYGLLVCLFQTIYQGLDKVKDIQINILINSFIFTGVTCVALYFNLGIWALVLGALASTTITAIGLYNMAVPFWKQVYHYKTAAKQYFFKDIVPLQIRYAVSFICSYVILYLYVPSAYKFIGPVEAGQLGLTASIVAVINGVTSNWIFTKVPKLNMYVSRRQYKELDRMVKNALLQGMIIHIIMAIFFVGALIIINHYNTTLAQRFLSVKLTILFLIPQAVQFLINGFTLYLRAFKKEPLMWLQVLNASLVLLSVFTILSSGLGLTTFFYAIIVINWLIVLPVTFYIFKIRRREFIYN